MTCMYSTCAWHFNMDKPQQDEACHVNGVHIGCNTLYGISIHGGPISYACLMRGMAMWFAVFSTTAAYGGLRIAALSSPWGGIESYATNITDHHRVDRHMAHGQHSYRMCWAVTNMCGYEPIQHIHIIVGALYMNIVTVTAHIINIMNSNHTYACNININTHNSFLCVVV